jgi:hypothetical protein
LQTLLALFALLPPLAPLTLFALLAPLALELLALFALLAPLALELLASLAALMCSRLRASLSRPRSLRVRNLWYPKCH